MMGAGIAARSACAGNRTVLVDTSITGAEKGRENAIGHIQELFSSDLLTAQNCEDAKRLIEVDTDLENALLRAKLVIEAIVENLEAKQRLFEKLDSLLPGDIVILSNTSGLRISDIQSLMSHPERSLTAHFWFPAHLVPLVEIVVGEKSDIRFAAEVKEILAKWGKKPVIVKKDLPGQLANRILQAVIREAVYIVETGLAEPEDVDTAIKAGMGIRFPVWGPLEHIEAVGLDLGLKVQQTVLPSISGSSEPSPYLENLVAEGNLGHKTGQGFYDWSKKDMGELAETRNRFIIHALRFLKE